jgi:hypothetical protein
LQKSSARALWRNTLCTALACIACASATEQAHAQTTPERVIHLFVEPKLGDDALALANNPKFDGSLSDGCPQPPQPAQSPWGPIDYRDPQQSNAPMLNAPYPFKTVTAAISYISALQHPRRSRAATTGSTPSSTAEMGCMPRTASTRGLRAIIPTTR